MIRALSILFTVFICVNLVKSELSDLSQVNVNDLQQQFSELAKTHNLSDAKDLLRNKCIEIADNDEEEGERAYKDIEGGSAVLMECVTNILNFTNIQAEIAEAKPKGNMDEVFQKYCNQRPQVLKCVEDFSAKITACLDEEEKQHKETLMRIVRSLLNFICDKDGDHIALFIAEKGPECLSSKQEEIRQCVNATFGDLIPKEGGIQNLKLEKIPKLVLGEKECQNMQTVERCVVQHLEKCSEITPANIVESMFRFVRRGTVCRNFIRNSGTNVFQDNLLLMFSIFISYALSRTALFRN